VTDLRKSLVGESRENGALPQINSANIRELDLGGNWDAHELGPSNCAFMAAVRTWICSIAERSSENLTEGGG